MIGAYRVIIALIISATVLAVTYMVTQVMVVEANPLIADDILFGKKLK